MMSFRGREFMNNTAALRHGVTEYSHGCMFSLHFWGALMQFMADSFYGCYSRKFAKGLNLCSGILTHGKADFPTGGEYKGRKRRKNSNTGFQEDTGSSVARSLI